MPRDIIKVTVKRSQTTVTDTFGEENTETTVKGSPFACRLFRLPQVQIPREEAAPGVTLLDQVRVLSFLDPATAVAVNDIAILPGGARAKILRLRGNNRRLQADLETGAE
ncbi:MAG: hypothetical protein ABIY70_18320 [Capsulimonas sp.]|uniref:hypothetical protein n=1 Tax=Capsulimonas sp. TaxID=2494211 RepID=UPI00326784D0